MAVFSSNRSHLGCYSGDEIVANENYMGSVGALQMTLEGFQTDQAIFESIIGMDFQEAMALNEGAEEVEVFTEAAAGNFAEKIKDFVKKAWEKIKGLFQTFLTKFNSVVMRDNKAFVDKYKKSVLTKDLGKMKYKWSEPKNGLAEMKLDAVESEVASAIKAATSDAAGMNEKIDSGDYLDGLLSKMIGSNTDSKEFNKDFHEAMFEDEDDEEGLKGDRLTKIISILSDKKIISDIEKSRKSIDKYFSKLLADINKVTNNVAKDVPSDSNERGEWKVGGEKGTYKKKNAGKAVGFLNTIYKAVSASQTGINMYTSRYLEAKKFEVKQARAVFARAAAFNPKAVKENAIFVEAAGDAAEYEVMSSFEDYSF